MLKYIIFAIIILLIGLVLLKKYYPSVYKILCKFCREIIKRIILAITVLITGDSRYPFNRENGENLKDTSSGQIDIARLKEEIAACKKLFSEEKLKVDKLKKKNDELNDILANREKELHESKKEIESLHDDKRSLQIKIEDQDCLIQKQNSQIEIQNKDINALRYEIKDLKGRFTPVNRTTVAERFCTEFYDVSNLLKEVEEKALHFVSALETDSTSSIVVEYFKNKPKISDDIYTWYLTLNGAGVLSGTAGMDVRSLKNDSDIVLYLRRHAFTEYYRPVSSHLLLMIEKIRTHTESAEYRAEFAKLAERLVKSLSEHEIDVLYLQAGMIYTLDEYSDLTIEPVNDNHPSNYILEVLHYGVNHRALDVIREKTEVKMNL